MRLDSQGVASACIVLGCLVVALAVPAAEKARPALAVGSIPENELGKDIDGNPVRLSEHHGKVVIVSFWASWCKPCREEIPVLAGVAKRVGPDQLKIIAINYRDETEPFRYVAKVLKEYPITVMRDGSGRTARKYKVRGIPRLIMIGRDGKVAADHTGYAESQIPQLVDELNELLLAKT
jgi:thiol-disulfide isomerase/thioredoxin